MAPTLVREPFHRDGWVYEEKIDGWRILAYKDAPRRTSRDGHAMRASSAGRLRRGFATSRFLHDARGRHLDRVLLDELTQSRVSVPDFVPDPLDHGRQLRSHSVDELRQVR